MGQIMRQDELLVDPYHKDQPCSAINHLDNQCRKVDQGLVAKIKQLGQIQGVLEGEGLLKGPPRAPSFVCGGSLSYAEVRHVDFALLLDVRTQKCFGVW